MNQHKWKDDAPCRGIDTDTFFDKYEEDTSTREMVDALCLSCPFARKCFATGVSNKEYGIWGGVFLEKGKISREFGSHRSKEDWAVVWQTLTMG